MELTRRSFVEGDALGTMGMLAATGRAAAAEGAGDEPAQEETPKTGTSFTPGTYMGSAMGNHGTVYVKVALGEAEGEAEGGPGSRPRIDEVAVAGHSDTDHVIYEVEKVMPQRIVDAQSTKVDIMAGATMSSNAVLCAVEDALGQAGVDPGSLVAPSVESSEETVSCEALVVGAGCAGMITAVALQKRGVDTLLVDRLDMIGGTGRFSGGNMFGTMDASEQSRIYDILRIAENDYEAVSSIKGFQLLSTLRDVYLDLGGTLRLGTKVESLVQDGQGAVTGAVASTRTGSLKIDADYVVVCSGSASANAEVLSKFGAALRAGVHQHGAGRRFGLHGGEQLRRQDHPVRQRRGQASGARTTPTTHSSSARTTPPTISLP